MVFVKVRETYDLHTTKSKMTVIAIHTPKPDIIKKNYPGLLMQCKAYRPVSADVRIACASMLPLDPQGVGTSEGDVSPEDVFNPILYKAMSNKGMSQLEARINWMSHNGASADVMGNTADVDVDSFITQNSDFDTYYGLLSNTHEWKHANPQAGLSMTGLRPLVYEMVYNIGDSRGNQSNLDSDTTNAPNGPGNGIEPLVAQAILGKAKEMPFLNCTVWSRDGSDGLAQSGFPTDISNAETIVPYINVVCGAIIIPPSRLHELFFRMVVEWTIEFSTLRPLGEIATWGGLTVLGQSTHYQNYDYSETKKAITGTSDTVLGSDACMVSSNAEINKVM